MSLFLTACSKDNGSDPAPNSDATAPVITLVGANPLNLSAGATYTDPGVTASDNVDGDISSNIAVAGDTVDTATPGTYSVTYDVSDAAGNAATQITRSVVVTDTTPPEITLTGANPLNLTVGATYSEPGSTALDDVDGDVTSSIATEGAVDTATIGTYTVTYDVTDAAGNAATQITRVVNVVSVIDVVPPVITLLDVNPLDIQAGSTYTEPGATALDDIDGDITGDIVVGGDTVNTAIIAVYIVTYDVSDTAGNDAIQVTRTVKVVNSPPEINSFSISSDPAYKDIQTSFSWDVSDINGDTLTCLLDVNNDGTDDYTINDCANNTSQTHTFTAVGDYTAKLTVDDGIATEVVDTINFTVISPLSTDVSVIGQAVSDRKVMYSITVSNISLVPLNAVDVLYQIPPELQFREWTDVEPNISCGAGGSDGMCGGLLDNAYWLLGTLAAGESHTITINATVLAGVLDGSSISAPIRVTSSDLSDDIEVTKIITVNNSPISQLAMSASKDPVMPGEDLVYQFNIGNIDSSALTNMELRATLPVGSTVNSISGGGVQDGTTGEIVWTESSLAVGNAIQQEVNITVDSGAIAGQILTARAELRHDGGVALDTSAEHAVTVVENTFPLAFDISATPDPVAADGRLYYDITVSNVSAVPVNSVEVLYRIPPELEFREWTDVEPNISCGAGGNDGMCGGSLTDAWWSLGTLTAGESRTITINAHVLSSVLAGTLISASVRITSPDVIDNIYRSNITSISN